MLLATSENIKCVDKYAVETLGITLYELIMRAGKAVATVVKKRVALGSKILILVGNGNNGADGYAAAKELLSGYRVTVYDVFGTARKNEAGRRHQHEFISLGGDVRELELNDEFYQNIDKSDCIIDAIFGTGFSGKVPEKLVGVAKAVNAQKRAYKIAIDIPLGVNANDGSVDEDSVCAMTDTVALTFLKPGIVSYPGKTYAGKLEYDNIGLHFEDLLPVISEKYCYVDKECASLMVPFREENSNKGSFGKLLMITGSETYPGAGLLTLEAALRGGVGFVTYLGERRIIDSFLPLFPEVIYKERPPFSDFNDATVKEILEFSCKHTVTLIGSGLGTSDALFVLLKDMLCTDSGPIIFDADAINALSSMGEDGRALLRQVKRTVILTPHPLEFARLTGLSVTEVQSNRLSLAEEFARQYDCILVLKGAGTIVTDGEKTYINSSGSSALSKAGSGDVLAGLIASLVAWMPDPLQASALSAYVHGFAADRLKEEYGEIGVTPSDLPKEIARTLSVLNKNRQNN